MAYTQDDIDTLRARLKAFAGVRATTFADQSTTFDYDAAVKLLVVMELEVNGADATRRGYRLATTNKMGGA